MSTIDKILEEREKTHGSFADHSLIAQRIKDVTQKSYDVKSVFFWHKLTATQKEALDMIAHKIGRILAGNPNFKDHWADIAGYATLIANTLED